MSWNYGFYDSKPYFTSYLYSIFNFFSIIGFFPLNSIKSSRTIFEQLDRIKRIKNDIEDQYPTNRIISFVKNPEIVNIKGVHLISIESPEVFKKSSEKLLKEIQKLLLEED